MCRVLSIEPPLQNNHLKGASLSLFCRHHQMRCATWTLCGTDTPPIRCAILTMQAVRVGSWQIQWAAAYAGSSMSSHIVRM